MFNLNPFVCGAFLDEEESEGGCGNCESPHSSSPRSKSRRNSFCRRSHSNNNNKNPYSSRGLDKFSALLADLEEKRQKIYSQIGPDHISFVRFAYPNSKDCVPIVVKLRGKDDHADDVKPRERNPEKQQHHSAPLASVRVPVPPEPAAAEKEAGPRRSFPWSGVSLDRLRRPSFYVPAVVVMILLLLTVFGRSVVILCTSVAWYAVPTISGGPGAGSFPNPKKITRKKELARRLSETARHGMSPPRISRAKVVAGGTRASSPEQLGSRKA